MSVINFAINPIVLGIFYGAGYLFGSAVIRKYVLSKYIKK